MASGTILAAIVRASRPTFRSRHDRLAFGVHAFMLSQGYTLVGVGPDATEPSQPGGGGVEEDELPEVPIDGWNAQDDWYGFKYADGSGGRPPVLIKCLKLGGQLLVNAVSGGELEAPRILELDTEVFTNGLEDVVKGYSQLDVMVEKMQGVLEYSGQSGVGSSETGPQDEKKTMMTNPEPTRGRAMPEVDPYRVDPLMDRPGNLRPGLPHMIGGGYDQGPGIGGGMHVGLNDPMFQGLVRNPEMLPGAPRGGMRFDPIGPPGMPGFRPDDFRQGGPRQGGRGGTHQHPDLPPMGGEHWGDSMFG